MHIDMYQRLGRHPGFHMAPAATVHPEVAVNASTRLTALLCLLQQATTMYHYHAVRPKDQLTPGRLWKHLQATQEGWSAGVCGCICTRGQVPCVDLMWWCVLLCRRRPDLIRLLLVLTAMIFRLLEDCLHSV
jgi:hypothetical protein